MTLRQFLTVWVGALALVAACVALIVTRPDSRPVFIGTSLSDHAVPEADPDIARLLSAPYVKHIHYGDRRHEILRELDLAQAAGAGPVFIEITHFLRQTSDQHRTSGWLAQGWPPLRGLGRMLLADIRVIGLETLSRLGIKRRNANRRVNRDYRLDPAQLAALYPIYPGPVAEHDDLVRAIGDLTRSGARVVLVVPPHSERAAELAGEGAFGDLGRLAAELSRQTGAPLFMPDGSWPDRYFIDTAHLNRAGRERFRDRLIAWLAKDRRGAIDG